MTEEEERLAKIIVGQSAEALSQFVSGIVRECDNRGLSFSISANVALSALTAALGWHIASSILSAKDPPTVETVLAVHMTGLKEQIADFYKVTGDNALCVAVREAVGLPPIPQPPEPPIEAGAPNPNSPWRIK